MVMLFYNCSTRDFDGCKMTSCIFSIAELFRCNLPSLSSLIILHLVVIEKPTKFIDYVLFILKKHDFPTIFSYIFTARATRFITRSLRKIYKGDFSMPINNN